MKNLDWPNNTIDGMDKIAPSIENIKTFLKFLNNPEKKIPPVIHITGTNGKGSTSSFLKSILEKNGYKVHRFISPHLVNINERIELCGKPIETEYFKELMNECKKVNEENPMRVSYFEGVTSIAFLAFSRVPADVVILEVGMGGLWDATNVIEYPIASIITPISLDHMQFLGDTVEKIAKEKAGIFKKNCPAIIAEQEDKVYKVLIEDAKSKNCEIYQYKKDWIVEETQNGFNFKYRDKNTNNDIFNTIRLPKPSLEGNHQFMNAGSAIMALLAQNKFDIKKELISSGITDTFWPARLQNLKNTKLFDEYLKDEDELWLDGGHNEGASQVLKNWIMEKNKKNKKPLIMISGMLGRKDSKAFLNNLKDVVDYAIAIRIKIDSTKDEKEYMKEMQEANINAISKENYKDALFHVKQKYKNENVRVLICGSLYLAGNILGDLK